MTRDERIKQLFVEEGKSLAEVARAVGLSREGVRYVLRKAGIDTAYRPPPPRPPAPPVPRREARHGTAYKYRQGCRCAACTAAGRARLRAARGSEMRRCAATVKRPGPRQGMQCKNFAMPGSLYCHGHQGLAA